MAWRKRRYVESSGSSSGSSRGRSRGRSRHKRRRRARSSSSSYTTYSRSSPSIFRRRGRREADKDSEYSYESESASGRKAKTREKEAKVQKASKGTSRKDKENALNKANKGDKAAQKLTPEKPKALEKSEKSQVPKEAAQKSTPEKPKAAEKSEKSQVPKEAAQKSTPEKPKPPDKSEKSQVPKEAAQKSTPEKPKPPDKSEKSQVPKEAAQKSTAEKPKAPEKSEKSQVPKEAAQASTPEKPKAPEKSEKSQTPKDSKLDISQVFEKSVAFEKLKTPPKSFKEPEKTSTKRKQDQGEASGGSGGSGGSESSQKKQKLPEKPKEVKGGLDTLALQRSLSQDTQNLQLMLLQAKRDLDDRRDTLEKQERREKEYYRGDYGEPLGPENRLLLEEALGQGAFSTVYRCRDMKAEGERHYAVKFIRKNSVLRTATEQEVKLMRRLRTQASELDPVGARCFLGLAGPEVIEHDGHLGLCFQLQRCDLRSALKRWGQGAGLPLGLVRNYARNVFLALRALKLVNIVHSDLKPDNLLVSMDKMSVKLSDFGSAMDVKDRLRPEKAAESLQPRYYRAPEVILGLPYDTQIDVWSAGCTIFELVTGKFLFTGRDNNHMLFLMMKQLGAFSRKFVGSGKLSDRHFRREDGAFRYGLDANGEPLKFVGREEFPRPPRPIMDEMKEPLQLDGGEAGQVAAKALVELILGCITPDPTRRVDPDAALSISFLRPSGNRVQ